MNIAQPVQPAEVGPISDEVLSLLIRHVAALERNELDAEGAAVILMCARPCLEELLAYRQRTSASLDLVPGDGSNVVALHKPET